MMKFRLYFDKDKETKWLNEMSGQGYAMTGFCMGFYSFEKCEPGEYIYQVDFTDGFFGVSEDYREFMQDTGVEVVCLWGYWVILRKKASEGAFELYTDVESRIENYTKIRKMFKIVACVEIACLTVELIGALHGSVAPAVCAWLIGALVVALVRQIMHLNEVLAELKGRIGETQECGMTGGKRKLSLFLGLGMLLNACALLMQNSALADSFFRGFVEGLAIVFMVFGIVQTCIKR